MIGSSVRTIDLAEDRRQFEHFLHGLGIPQPPGAGVTSVEDALTAPSTSATPCSCAPATCSAGGRWRSSPAPRTWCATCTRSPLPTGKPVLIDKYLEGKEVEVDAICDGGVTLIPGIMEHIERAGVHSGDSIAVYPGINLTEEKSSSWSTTPTASPPRWRCGA